MNTLTQALLLDGAAGGTRLAGLECARRRFDEFATSFHHFVANQLHQPRGGGVEYFAVQPSLLPDVPAGFFGGSLRAAGHVADREGFHHDQGVFVGQSGAKLVLVLQAPAGLVRPGASQCPNGLLAPMGAAFLAADGLLQARNAVGLLLMPARVFLMPDAAFVIDEGEQMLQSPIHADGAIGDALTNDPLRLDSERQPPLAVAVEQVGGADTATLASLSATTDMSHPADPQATVLPVLAGIEGPTVAVGLEAEAGEAGQRLEAREAGRLAALCALEERLERLVQPAQRHLLAGTVRDGPFGHGLADDRQRAALVGVADTQALFLPCTDALFQSGVVELLMAAQQRQQQGFLRAVGVEPVAHLAFRCTLNHHWFQ